MDVNNSLLEAVRVGDLKTTKKIVNTHGLAYSKSWAIGYNLLVHSTKNNHIEITKFLLSKGARVNINNSKRRRHLKDSPLHFAAQHGQLEIVQILLKRGANVHAKNACGATPLQNSINRNKLQVAEFLLNNGANVNERCRDGSTSLHTAVLKGNITAVKMLLKYKANVNVVTTNSLEIDDQTPLHFAAQHGQLQIVQMLLDKGANIHAKNEYGATALQNSIYRNKLEVAEFLLNQGANVNERCRDGSTSLHTAVLKGNITAVEMLLKYKANVNVTNSFQKDGQTPLHLAAKGGKDQIVELLLQNKASIEATAKGLTPIYFATLNRKEKVVEILLKHGANVDAHDTSGKTILFLAVELGNIKMVNLILQHEPCLKNKMNNSSLQEAINGSKKKYKLIVEKLFEYGFGTLEPDINLLQTVIRKGYTDIVENYLRTSPGVKSLLNNLTDKSYSLLMVAVQEKQYNIVQMLIANGSNPNLKDGSDKTALFYATLNGDIQMVKILLAKGASVTNCSGLLINAVKNENIEMVHLLLEHKVDVKEVDNLGRTALHYCAIDASDSQFPSCMELFRKFQKFAQVKDGKIKKDIAKVLLEAGADVNASATDGRSALHWACCNGYYDLVNILFQFNAKMFKDEAETLPLHLSACSGNIDILKMLISKGADVNAKTVRGMTALHFAACDQQTQFMEYLFGLGVNIDEVDRNGFTALHIASGNDFLEVVEFLLKNGADVDSTNNKGRTPLNLATREDSAEIVRILVEYGCDINSQYKTKMSDCDKALLMMLGINKVEGILPLDDYDYDDDDDFYGQDMNYFDYSDNDDYDEYDEYLDELNMFPSDEINQFVQFHIIRMKAANLQGKEETVTIPSAINKLCETKCEQEVKKLKMEKICPNTNVTFYDILYKSIDNVAIYARNPKILEILTNDDYKTKFPEYYGLIKGKIIRGINRKNLLDRGYEFFNLLSERLEKVLPYNCIVKICSYLSDNELKILVESVKPKVIFK